MPRIAKRLPRRKIPKGVICVRAGLRNTIITATNTRGQAFCWASAGACGFKGPKKRSPFATQVATENIVDILVNHSFLKEAEVRIKGSGPGRETAIRIISQSGIYIRKIVDLTGYAHNGCRPPRKKRL
uniref:Small ribosomal subunit protein uS11c n=1 Tax=Callitris rhomboidea TaxID=13383 RepID=A0A1Y1B775_9CONI|nr:ribosomal protein S11 [Callitris rhomboidea]BAX56261.1 ribosomal protein S11 [Callitris rhomboidea]